MLKYFLPFLGSILLAATPALRDKAPDFTLSDLEGKPVRLSQEYAQAPVVLVMLRGFPGYQCPLCNRQVQDFLKNSDSFAAAGARLLLVYPGPPGFLNQKAEEFLKGKTLPANFHLVIDPGYTFTNLYGLRWDSPQETAYPSTFIINKQGVVTFAKVSREHGDRATAAELLEHLKH